jgi:hypothetical protein
MKLHNYTGKEFKEGDPAMIDWGGGEGNQPCTVVHYSEKYGGWWYVQLGNGAMHYTQRLVIP